MESLFTNIPLDETINIVTNKVFEGKENVNGICKDDFKTLLKLSTKGTIFYFDGHYYRQKDGVAMGSPLGPALANAFLSHHETTWLDECPLSFAPMFYARYVDDIFVLLNKGQDIIRLCEYLSSRHLNIKFTYEEEVNDTLPFLDVNVFRDANRFSSTVHRKETFSGVYTNFKSFLPEVYKKGLISSLLYRAYRISSSYESLHQEIENLKKIFTKNGYEMKLFDRCVLNFFNKIFDKRKPVEADPKEELLIILPFLGTSSFNVKNELIRTFKKFSPSCSFKVIFKTSTRLSSCFSFKDIIPKSLVSGVIYKYTCPTCNRGYIGSSKRFWEKRLEEHLHISALTGKPLNGLQVFAPMQHVRMSSDCTESNIAREDFQIIGREQNAYILRIKESIHINHERPQLNSM